VSREVWSASVPDRFEAAMPEPPSPERVPMQRIGGVVASRLTKRFGDFTAVDAIDFVVDGPLPLVDGEVES
jgi:hypothetical protein